MGFSVGWSFEFELNFSLFEENKISKTYIFYKFRKQRQSSNYLEYMHFGDFTDIKLILQISH